MRFVFTVEIEVERVQGLFASRDEIGELLDEALNEANPDSIDQIGANGDSEYAVIPWDVSEVIEPKKGKSK